MSVTNRPPTMTRASRTVRSLPPAQREDRWDRLASQNVIHQDLERPRREQAGRDAGDGDEHRADGQLPVRSHVAEDSPEVGHDSSRQ